MEFLAVKEGRQLAGGLVCGSKQRIQHGRPLFLLADWQFPPLHERVENASGLCVGVVDHFAAHGRLEAEAQVATLSMPVRITM